MRLLAEEAGQVIVTLNVTWAPNTEDERLLTDSITVQVQAALYSNSSLLFTHLLVLITDLQILLLQTQKWRATRGH